MATIKMAVYEVGGGRFAIGQVDKRARYVLRVKGTKISGVKGQRPVLTKGRYARITPTPEMRKAFQAALA